MSGSTSDPQDAPRRFIASASTSAPSSTLTLAQRSSRRTEPSAAKADLTSQSTSASSTAGDDEPRSLWDTILIQLGIKPASPVPKRPKEKIAATSGARSSSEPPDESTDSTTKRRVRNGSGIAMLVAGALAFGFAMTQGGSGLSEEELRTLDNDAFSLRQEISAAKSKLERLPSTRDAERSLVVAQEAAADVAVLQNNYRFLSRALAGATAGDPVPGMAVNTYRDMRPYFTAGSGPGVLGPWYLLAADSQADPGFGVPQSFDSGFEWQAEPPYTVTESAEVEMTWLALDKATGRVLAWARADYNTTTQTFDDLSVNTTSEGQQLSTTLPMEVSD